ncbi:group II intron reverse transcriptase/maturase [Erysipelotrichaceae bacterium AF15-26LB]|nr:reverse transcriptase (RNA-dependent DNA polymerase) [Erysipelotrichaceae bacterium 3_1_53]MCR0347515.1 group II intron reverse transcriptase/maturase [[Clostridium] innocuum]RJV87733.1 group II intron reverse transcriptase/maturase [Erysipelotrichaceae bacterium AF19-24AC]RJV89163.1 group II intron reverse transcriptase/maturase [Erysipelotrichaceae bacterium AF15-26LB]
MKVTEECRKQETGYTSKNSTEYEGMKKVYQQTKITENTATIAVTVDLMEEIMGHQNLIKACKRVISNKGRHGMDGMSVKEVMPFILEHEEEIRETVVRGKYKPKPVRRVEIPKDDGTKRKLGVPTVIDRVIQQAMVQVLSPIYEPQFLENSYGYRPKKNQHQAIRQAQKYIQEGYNIVISIDLEKYFDTVNHSKLIQVLSEIIKDGRVVSLIHKYLNAGVMANGVFEKTEVGFSQGGNISPLLSNIMLNELDKELERRKLRFVRFADDTAIFVKSRRSAERVSEGITKFIEEKLKLKVNRRKTSILPATKIKYLGFSFYIASGRKVGIRVHPKNVKKMKDKIREITKRNSGCGYAKLKKRLTEYIRGWVNYFKIANMKKVVLGTDEWLRHKIRCYIWKSWKKPKVRRYKLAKLGVSKEKARMLSGSREGLWKVSGYQDMNKAITNKKLERAGYPTFAKYYL